MKPGDMALFRSPNQNLNNGKIVTCVKFLGNKELLFKDTLRPHERVWQVAPPLVGLGPVGLVETDSCPEKYLVPIQNPGDEDEDEMVTIMNNKKKKEDALLLLRQDLKTV